MSLLKSENKAYKPFQYPWAYEVWLKQQQIHWLPEEVPLADDVKDWKTSLSKEEVEFLSQIFRFFTQSDIEVNDCYMTRYANVFKPTEVKMMLSAFSNMETIHVAAYSHLLDTLGLPEVEYSAFLRYKEMKDKYDYLQGFNIDTLEDIAKTMAVFGAFTEGLQLFASFVMLMSFQRFNKMKGMGQIVAWSVRDETLHCESIIKLYHTFLSENSSIDVQKLNTELTNICSKIIEMEDAFIDSAFKGHSIAGLQAEDVKKYIRYIANIRLSQLKIKTIFDEKENPLPWVDEIVSGVEHVNFFENRVTEYSKAATKGDWGDAFEY